MDKFKFCMANFVIYAHVSGLATVELNVDMHCEACAAHVAKKRRY